MEVSDQLHAPAALPPGKELLDTHWVGDWVGPRAGLVALVMSPVAFHGSYTWSLALREEHRLRVSENLPRIFGPVEL